MDWITVLVLGIVQGITEFLPISSDGHLAVAEKILETVRGKPLEDLLGLNIILHAGTLLAIVVFYWRRIARLFVEDRRVIGLIAVGTLPVVVVGYPLHKLGAEWLTNTLLAGLMLPLTGLLLIWAARRPVGDADYRDLGYGQALLIGLAQTVAILPGISRSGTTIAAGLGLGLRRESAATYSFLLAIPSVAGAVLLEIKKLAETGGGSNDLSELAVGALVAFVVGLAAIGWLLKWLQQGRLHYFAYWCIPFGLAVVAWQLLSA